MALSTQDFNRILQESSGYSGFGMKRYDELSSLGASNRQMVEIALNTPVVGTEAAKNLIANFDVSQGFGQLANDQLTQLGATKDQIIDIASNAPVIGDRMIEEYPELEKVDYNIRHANLKQQLQAQYDTLIEAAPEAAYGGRQSDIDKIFFNQAKKLADKGVGDLAELGEFADESGNRFVTNRNTGEQLFKINRDRDTGVNKWGDVFSGVKDGANFGIEFDPEGRAVLFPVHEKTKGLAQQLVGRDLAKLVTPIATVAGAIYGGGSTSALTSLLGSQTAGAAAGAALGSTGGQLATSGKVDLGKVALSAALAGTGQELFGGAEAVPVAETGTMAASTAVPGSFQAALPELGVQTAATTPGFTALPGSFQAALPSLISPVNAMGDTAQGLLNQDLEFLSEETANLYQASGGDLNAIQQNLIANGVDPIVAAEAANQAALTMGQSAFYDVSGAVPVLTDPAGQFAAGMSGIQSGLSSALPGEAIITSQGLLSGGATLDKFAKDIANISSIPETGLTALSGLNIGVGDALLGAALLTGGGQTATGFPQQQAPFQPTGVDYSGIYGLLGQRASVPGIASLLGPAQLRYPSLLG